MTSIHDYIRYSDEIEVKQPNEDEQTRQVVDSMSRVNRLMFDKLRHAVRDAHAKSHGILRGEFQVYPNLPQHLAQGIFASPKSYPVIIRYSTAPGAIMPDGMPTLRGMAVKLIGVEGKKFLAEEADAVTQDFLLVNHPIIPTGTIETYLEQQQKLEKMVNLPEEVQEIQAKLTTAAYKALNVVGIHPDPNNIGAGKPNTHILGETFFSMAALRYGDFVAKISAAPLSDNLKALAGKEIEGKNESELRDLVVDFFQNNTAEYEVRVQLCTNLEKMPVEDGSIEWPQELSPYQVVGKITILPQDAYSPRRRVYGDDVLSFNPFHCISEHRPLGGIMRIRKLAYETSSKYRHHMNAQPRIEPTDIGELPD